MGIDIAPFAEQVCQKKLGVHHILVKQKDKTVAEFHFQQTDRRTDIHSATKSIVSLAVGIAIDEGLLSLDTKPVEILNRYLPKYYDEHWNQVRVRHLLMMSSGHDHKLMDGYSMIPGSINRDDLENLDWVNYTFSQSLQLKPGEKFVYNNACPHILARMICELTGENLIDWLQPRLFEPLKIANPQWLTDPLGYTCGPGGLQLTTEEFSRIAQLCLNHGKWNGCQLVSAEYIQEATGRRIETCQEAQFCDTSDITAGYGYFFWRAYRDEAYYLSGWGGQLAIVLPKYEAVIALHSYEFDTQILMDTIWKTIVSQWK
ncbi:MAG: serine hydrolase [Lachnospiraceae bacterium]|nr:serine hydrolase [Lachnospiraceae bacterium]